LDVRIGNTPQQFKGDKLVPWAPGDGIHLAKGQPVPITIKWHLNGGSKQSIKVGLQPIPVFNTAPAKQADVAIVCTGRLAGECNDSFFELPLVQQHLVKAVVAANPRTIVVNTSGAGLDLARVSESVPALVQAWFLGQEACTAIGDVLFGRVNPSRRLPMTFDRNLNDNAAFANYPGDILKDTKQPPFVKYQEGIFVGYRGYAKSGKAPLFPFGYGLSYTHFKFSNLKVQPTADGAKATLDVTNSGAREGAEVVQLYVGQPKAPVERPLRELKGIAKVSLKPGETQQVIIDLPRDSFAYWSPAKKAWTVDAGQFIVEAGASSRDIRLKQFVQIGQ
jgi:beta-glucosidase